MGSPRSQARTSSPMRPRTTTQFPRSPMKGPPTTWSAPAAMHAGGQAATATCEGGQAASPAWATATSPLWAGACHNEVGRATGCCFRSWGRRTLAWCPIRNWGGPRAHFCEGQRGELCFCTQLCLAPPTTPSRPCPPFLPSALTVWSERKGFALRHVRLFSMGTCM